MTKRFEGCSKNSLLHTLYISNEVTTRRLNSEINGGPVSPNLWGNSETPWYTVHPYICVPCTCVPSPIPLSRSLDETQTWRNASKMEGRGRDAQTSKHTSNSRHKFTLPLSPFRIPKLDTPTPVATTTSANSSYELKYVITMLAS